MGSEWVGGFGPYFYFPKQSLTSVDRDHLIPHGLKPNGALRANGKWGRACLTPQSELNWLSSDELAVSPQATPYL